MVAENEAGETAMKSSEYETEDTGPYCEAKERDCIGVRTSWRTAAELEAR